MACPLSHTMCVIVDGIESAAKLVRWSAGEACAHVEACAARQRCRAAAAGAAGAPCSHAGPGAPQTQLPVRPDEPREAALQAAAGSCTGSSLVVGVSQIIKSAFDPADSSTCVSWKLSRPRFKKSPGRRYHSPGDADLELQGVIRRGDVESGGRQRGQRQRRAGAHAPTHDARPAHPSFRPASVALSAMWPSEQAVVG